MSSRLLTFLAAGALACSGMDPGAVSEDAPPVPVTPAAGVVSRVQVEKDLALEIHRPTTAPYEEDRNPHLGVTLVNRSRVAYPIVLSNDGSEVGWREPHVWFSLERRTASGPWTVVPPPQLLRCGLYARDWTQDVVSLPPGDRTELPWFWFDPSAALGDTTSIRVTAHYAYGAHARDKSKVPPVLHSMPEYELVSPPLEMAVGHPYTLDVHVKGPLPVTDHAPIAAFLAIDATNTTRAVMPFATADGGGQVWLEAEVARAAGDAENVDLFLATAQTGTHVTGDTIRPGEKRGLVGSSTTTDVGWGLRQGDRVLRVRAFWRVWDDDVFGQRMDDGTTVPNQRRVSSEWVDVAR
jgi:hypothetical protein